MNELPVPSKCTEDNTPDHRASENFSKTSRERPVSCVRGPSAIDVSSSAPKKLFHLMKSASLSSGSDASSSSSVDLIKASSSTGAPVQTMTCPQFCPTLMRIVMQSRPREDVENHVKSCHSRASNPSAPLINLLESSIGSSETGQPISSLSLCSKPSKHMFSGIVNEMKLIKSSPSHKVCSSSKQLVPMDVPKTLKCRSGSSSPYPLRALKAIPIYSEHPCSSPTSLSRKRAKMDTYETIKCCNNDDMEAARDVGPINFLPDEILCKILSYLPRLELIKSCEKVNRRWHSVARSPPLWSNLYFSGDEISIETVAGLIRFAPHNTLRTITIKDRDDIDVILPIIHQQSRRLENVSIVRCHPFVTGQKNLRAKSLYPFLKKGLLRSLNLKGTDYKSRKFYELLKAVSSLRKLNISCSRSITPQILSEIAYYPNLKIFKNKWHSNSVFNGSKSIAIHLPGKIEEWASAYSLLFQNVGRNLTTLEFYAAGISDEVLSDLACCKNLLKLCIYNANHFGEKSLTAVSCIRGLQELVIHNAVISAAVLSSTFQTGNFENLKSLHLNDSIHTSNDDDLSSDRFSETMAAKCQNLQHLSLTQFSGITDVGVKSILTNCGQLLSLDLHGCLSVSGQSFLLIPIKTPLLKLLVIEEDCTEEKKQIALNLTQQHGLKVQNRSTWKNRLTSVLLW